MSASPQVKARGLNLFRFKRKTAERASQDMSVKHTEKVQTKDEVELSSSKSTSKEAAVHYGVSGALLAGLATAGTITALFGAAAGAGGLGLLGIAAGVGVAVGVGAGIANAVRGYRSAKQANPSMLKKAENALHYGVSGFVGGIVGTMATIGAIEPGAGLIVGSIMGPKVGLATGAINAVRGWLLKG